MVVRQEDPSVNWGDGGERAGLRLRNKYTTQQTSQQDTTLQQLCLFIG